MYIIKRSESVHMILGHAYYVDTVISRQETFYLYAFDDFKRTRCADCAYLSCHLCITQGLSQLFEGSLYNIQNINKLEKKLYKNKNDRCLLQKQKLALFPHDFTKILGI